MADAPRLPAPQDNPEPPQRTVSAERLRAVSAARIQPVKEKPVATGPVSARLKEGATETALNAAGILRDLWGDFRSSDRFFKYKALIVAAWVVLSVGTLFVACPGGQGPANSIGALARLKDIAGSATYVIVNQSGEDWEDVVVVFDDRYRAAVDRVPGEHGSHMLALDPKNIIAEGGQPAPRDYKPNKIEVKTSSGRALLHRKGDEYE